MFEFLDICIKCFILIKKFIEREIIMDVSL